MTRGQIVEAFAMKLDGCTFQQIGDRFGVSKQRIQQLLSAVLLKKSSPLRLDRNVYSEIARLMVERNISYKYLDDNLAAGKKGHIYRVLTGSQNMTVNDALKLSELFGLPLDQIIKKKEQGEYQWQSSQ